jgi:hypothetical protein
MLTDQPIPVSKIASRPSARQRRERLSARPVLWIVGPGRAGSYFDAIACVGSLRQPTDAGSSK